MLSRSNMKNIEKIIFNNFMYFKKFHFKNLAGKYNMTAHYFEHMTKGNV